MRFNQVLAYFPEAKKNGNGYKTLCPAHEDVNPSLRLSEAKNGNTLIKCFAGCATEAVVRAAGLTMSDLFVTQQTKSKAPQKRARPHGQIAATYDYFDQDGTLLYQTVRYYPKDFSQRRPNGKGGWIENLRGVRRVLYQLPALQATESEVEVFLPEGEKDVDRLRNRLVAMFEINELDKNSRALRKRPK